MPKNALVAISPRPGSSTEQLARQWIVTFAELFCVSLKDRGSRFVDLWVAALADLPAEVLDASCKRAMQVCKFFPTPAEVRALIDRTESKALALGAVQSWERALSVAERDGHGYDALDAATQHAIRAAGGLGWIESCPRDELQWARKRFIEDYTLIQETLQAEHFLSDGEAKKIIRQLTAPSKPKPKELSRVTALSTAQPLTPEDPIRGAFAALRGKLSQSEAVCVLGEREFAARRELLRRQAAEILGARNSEKSA